MQAGGRQRERGANGSAVRRGLVWCGLVWRSAMWRAVAQRAGLCGRHRRGRCTQKAMQAQHARGSPPGLPTAHTATTATTTTTSFTSAAPAPARARRAERRTPAHGTNSAAHMRTHAHQHQQQHLQQLPQHQAGRQAGGRAGAAPELPTVRGGEGSGAAHHRRQQRPRMDGRAGAVAAAGQPHGAPWQATHGRESTRACYS